MNNIEITRATPEDTNDINQLIINVFEKCVAPDYSEEGIKYFLSICTNDEILNAIDGNNCVFIAKVKNKIIGVIWTRDINHLSRYFVDNNFQKQGIGKKLFEHLLFEITSKKKDINVITVNSSPYAVTAYEKLGFEKTGDEKIGDGMRIIPMMYNIGNKNKDTAHN